MENKKRIITDLLWTCRYVFVSAVVLLVLVAHYSEPTQQNARTLAPSQRKLIQFINSEPAERGKTLHIIGERHSGTRWMNEHLNECFNTSVDVSPRLTRWKHWFQYEEDLDAFNDLYVVALFRNPYDWVDMLRKYPEHTPMHMDMEWSEFVSTPWSMPRTGRDLQLARNASMARRICDQSFFPDEVVPCLEEGRVNHMRAKYELRTDRSGLPYDSVVDVRADKILNFLSVEQFDGVKFFENHKYEDLMAEGSESLVRELERVMGIKATCTPTRSSQAPTRRPTYDQEYLDWMSDNVDWDTEALIGYHRSDY